MACAVHWIYLAYCTYSIQTVRIHSTAFLHVVALFSCLHSFPHPITHIPSRNMKEKGKENLSSSILLSCASLLSHTHTYTYTPICEKDKRKKETYPPNHRTKKESEYQNRKLEKKMRKKKQVHILRAPSSKSIS